MDKAKELLSGATLIGNGRSDRQARDESWRGRFFQKMAGEVAHRRPSITCGAGGELLQVERWEILDSHRFQPGTDILL